MILLDFRAEDKGTNFFDIGLPIITQHIFDDIAIGVRGLAKGNGHTRRDGTANAAPGNGHHVWIPVGIL